MGFPKILMLHQVTATEDEWWGLRRFEDEAGLGDETADQAIAVLHPLELGFDHSEPVGIAGCEIGQAAFEVRPHALSWVQLGRVGA